MAIAPGGPPQTQSAPPQQAQGGGGDDAGSIASQAVHQIQQGFMQLGKIMQSAGQQLPPEDLKLFQQAATATDAFIQSITGPAGQGQPQPRTQSGPMPDNANAGAKPAM